MSALEMAYNINDCAELRWGAPEGSEEASPANGVHRRRSGKK